MTAGGASACVLVSAPGKAILFGEHAVVYGKRAVAASLDVRTCAVSRRTDGAVTLHLPDLGFSYRWDASLVHAVAAGGNDGDEHGDATVDHSQAPETTTTSTIGTPHPPQISPALFDPAPIASRLRRLLPENVSEPASQAALAFLTLFTLIYATNHQSSSTPPHPDSDHSQGIEIKISSKLPVGAGLGSSASFSVCAAASLLAHAGRIHPVNPPSPLDLESINNWAFLAEKTIHGNPSGLDNSLCTFGGAQVYTKHRGMKRLEGFKSFGFLLTDTGVPKNTRNQVEKVASRKESFPAIMDPILDAVEGISDAFLDACRKHREGAITETELTTKLGMLMDMNHCMLAACGVSHPSLEQVKRISAEYGMRAKLTGAGGGGCAITLISPDTSELTTKALQTSLSDAGFRSFRALLGGAGVSLGTMQDDVIDIAHANIHELACRLSSRAIK